jgi:phage terminase small subunit
MGTMKDKTKTGQRRTQLTDKQRRFILEYIKDRNGTQAAIRAGYSKQGADVAAIRLLGNARISAEIEEVVGEVYKDLKLDGKTILNRVNDISDFDPAEMFDKNRNHLDIPDLPIRARKCIASYDFVTLYEGDGEQKHAFGVLRKIRFADRLKASELLGKHLKLWTDVVQHGLDDDARKLLAGKIDLTRATPEQLAELATLGTGSTQGQSEGRVVPAEPAVVAPAPHKDPR